MKGLKGTVSREKEVMDKERNEEGMLLDTRKTSENKIQEDKKSNNFSMLTGSTKIPSRKKKHCSIGTAGALIKSEMSEIMETEDINRTKQKYHKMEKTKHEKRAVSSNPRQFRSVPQDDQTSILTDSFQDVFSLSNQPFEESPCFGGTKFTSNWLDHQGNKSLFKREPFSPSDRLFSAPRVGGHLGLRSSAKNKGKNQVEIRDYKPKRTLFPSTLYFIPKQVPLPVKVNEFL